MVKAVTTLFLVGALLLALSWPFQLEGIRGKRNAPLAERRAVARKLLYHTSGIVVCLVGAGLGSVIIIRRARREYREEAMKNLRSLIEGESKDPEA